MTTLKIILASTRPGTSGRAIGAWVAEGAQNAPFDTVEIVDLAEVNLPFLDEPEHPKLGRYTHSHTFAWSRTIDEADALVIVTPEYNGGFPAPLKNALDFLHAEWKNKALGLVTYSGGPRGGAGAAAMLAPVTRILGLVTAETSIAIGKVAGRLDEGNFVATEDEDLQLASMLDEIVTIDGDLAPLRSQLAMAG